MSINKVFQLFLNKEKRLRMLFEETGDTHSLKIWNQEYNSLDITEDVFDLGYLFSLFVLLLSPFFFCSLCFFLFFLIPTLKGLSQKKSIVLKEASYRQKVNGAIN